MMDAEAIGMGLVGTAGFLIFIVLMIPIVFGSFVHSSPPDSFQHFRTLRIQRLISSMMPHRLWWMVSLVQGRCSISDLGQMR